MMREARPSRRAGRRLAFLFWRILVPLGSALAFLGVGFALVGLPGGVVVAAVAAVAKAAGGPVLPGEAMWPAAIMTTLAMGVAILPGSLVVSAVAPRLGVGGHVALVTAIVLAVSAAVALAIVLDAPPAAGAGPA